MQASNHKKEKKLSFAFPFSVPFLSFCRNSGLLCHYANVYICQRIIVESTENSFLSSSLVIKMIFSSCSLIWRIYSTLLTWFTDLPTNETTKMTNDFAVLLIKTCFALLFYLLYRRSELCLFGALTGPAPASTTSSSISRATFRTWSTYGNELLLLASMEKKMKRTWWTKSNRRSRQRSPTKTFLLSIWFFIIFVLFCRKPSESSWDRFFWLSPLVRTQSTFLRITVNLSSSVIKENWKSNGKRTFSTIKPFSTTYSIKKLYAKLCTYLALTNRYIQ